MSSPQAQAIAASHEPVPGTVANTRVLRSSPGAAGHRVVSHRMSPPRSRKTRGMALVVVLVVVTLLTLGALTFSELMMAEREGAEVAVLQSQTRALADSGVELIRMFLAQDAQVQQQSGGWYDNPSQFRGVGVIYEGGQHGVGRFTVVAPAMDSDGRLAGIRYGLEDESTKLNLNMVLAADMKLGGNAGRRMLMALPGMTEDVADAILDWIDLDDEPRDYGAEIESYAAASPAYATKNGPLDTLEELLLVRGVTPSMLFGVDTNRNHLVDRAESAGTMIVDAGNAQGTLDCGWAAYLTIYSYESTRQPDGQPRIDLARDASSEEDRKKFYEELQAVLAPDWAKFIVFWRQGADPSGSTANLRPVAECEPDFSQPFQRKPQSVLDLVGKNVRCRVLGQNSAVVVQTPFPDEPFVSGLFLPKLLDHCTVGSAVTVMGRVNINTASRVALAAVLAGVLGSDDEPFDPTELVDAIVSERPENPDQADESFLYETWLYSRAIVDLDQMKKLFPYVCARGSVYRAQVIGYFDNGGPSARLEVVVDATNIPPRMVFWRDMTHLGRGYPLETLGVEAFDSP